LLYGLLRKDKGLNVAVEAYERLGRGTLLLVGKPLKEEDEEVVERAKEVGAVHIPGFASDEVLGTFIRSSDYVLLPYEDLPNDFGISGAFHTTIATGGYPLCSRVQRLVECWERARELTFRPGDPADLARLMSAPRLQDAWGRLRAYADLTSWSNVASLRERIYSLLI
jgi:glycosyltransferase involved in cell wall biosynthesis